MPIFAVSFSGEKRTRAPLLKKLTLRAIFSPKVLCARRGVEPPPWTSPGWRPMRQTNKYDDGNK